jgi:hypothetical protein
MSVYDAHHQATLLAMHLQSVQSLVHRGRAQLSAQGDAGPNPSAFSLLTELLAALTHSTPVRLSPARTAHRRITARGDARRPMCTDGRRSDPDGWPV